MLHLRDAQYMSRSIFSMSLDGVVDFAVTMSALGAVSLEQVSARR